MNEDFTVSVDMDDTDTTVLLLLPERTIDLTKSFLINEIQTARGCY